MFVPRKQKQDICLSKRNIAVIYHGSCSDGFSGAWVARKKFGNKADYIPGLHDALPPCELKNKELYFIDFVYPEPVMRELAKQNKKIVIIDHHITSKPILKLANEYRYKIENSGSVLAWEYFFPEKKIPAMLKYVEDTDLWKFKLSFSKEIFAFSGLFDFSFKDWDILAANLENNKLRKEAIEKGRVILAYENKVIKRLVEYRELVEFEGHKTYVVNAPIYHSQVGAELRKILPPIAIVWRYKAGRVHVSLRSDGKVDVSKIAQKYGGGGHKAASSFYLHSQGNFPWKGIKK